MNGSGCSGSACVTGALLTDLGLEPYTPPISAALPSHPNQGSRALPAMSDKTEIWGYRTSPWDYDQGEQWILDRFESIRDATEHALKYLEDGDLANAKRSLERAERSVAFLSWTWYR
jgi:hypothetical protein